MPDLTYKLIAQRLLRVMREITQLEEGDLGKYCLKADSIAVSACIQAELSMEDLEASPRANQESEP